MDSPDYDAETVALMGRVCDDAWQELQTKVFFPSLNDARDVRHLIALRVVTAVSDGERNPERLMSIALNAIDT